MLDNTTTKDDKTALYAAITELILDLKGDGTLSSLQNKIGIHRNVLSAIFRVYDGQKTGNKVLTKSETPKEKELYWEMDSLITIADKLGIRVSELIRAAEDVRDGLPPWFQVRIACGHAHLHDTGQKATTELGRIFLEALGCFSYANPFPAAEEVKNERQYRRKTSSENVAEMYSEDECRYMECIAIQMFETGELRNFVDAYKACVVTSKDSYDIMKAAVNHARCENSFEGKIDDERLFEWRNGFVRVINGIWNQQRSEIMSRYEQS